MAFCNRLVSSQRSRGSAASIFESTSTSIAASPSSGSSSDEIFCEQREALRLVGFGLPLVGTDASLANGHIRIVAISYQRSSEARGVCTKPMRTEQRSELLGNGLVAERSRSHGRVAKVVWSASVQSIGQNAAGDGANGAPMTGCNRPEPDISTLASKQTLRPFFANDRLDERTQLRT